MAIIETYRSHSTAVLALFVLAGCFGSDGGGDDGDMGGDYGGDQISSGLITFGVPSDSDFSRLPPDGRTLLNAVIDVNENSVQSPSLPASGSATYLGEVGMVDDIDEVVILGTAELGVADFSDPIVSGQFKDFTLYENGGSESVSGTIDVEASQFTGTRFSGGMSGVLSGSNFSVRLNGSVEGAFAGTQADQMLGTVEGMVTEGDVNNGEVSGVFLLDRQN